MVTRFGYGASTQPLQQGMTLFGSKGTMRSSPRHFSSRRLAPSSVTTALHSPDEMTYWLPVRGFKAIVHTPLWNKLLSLTIVSHKSQDAAAHKDKKIGSPLEGSQRNRTTSGLLRSGPQWCSRRWGRASPSGHQCGRHWPGRSSARRRCHTDARRTVRQWRCSTAKH